jgi:hypothetical protein
MASTLFTYTSQAETGMLPGGYDFIHLVFWTVVGLVAVGTNFMAIVLSFGVGVLLMETFGIGKG